MNQHGTDRDATLTLAALGFFDCHEHEGVYLLHDRADD